MKYQKTSKRSQDLFTSLVSWEDSCYLFPALTISLPHGPAFWEGEGALLTPLGAQSRGGNVCCDLHQEIAHMQLIPHEKTRNTGAQKKVSLEKINPLF